MYRYSRLGGTASDAVRRSRFVEDPACGVGRCGEIGNPLGFQIIEIQNVKIPYNIVLLPISKILNAQLG